MVYVTLACASISFWAEAEACSVPFAASVMTTYSFPSAFVTAEENAALILMSASNVFVTVTVTVHLSVIAAHTTSPMVISPA